MLYRANRLVLVLRTLGSGFFPRRHRVCILEGAGVAGVMSTRGEHIGMLSVW